jgi:hypothetical protein
MKLAHRLDSFYLMKGTVAVKRTLGVSIVTMSALGAILVFSTPALAVNNVRAYYDTMPLGGYYPYACYHGHSYQGIPDSTYRIDNNCDVRVWLYQNLDGSGYNFCVSPGTSFHPNRQYERLWISENSSNCGS